MSMAWKVVRVIVGLVSLAAGIAAVPISVALSLLLGGVAGICLYPFATELLARGLCGFDSQSAMVVPREYSRIRGLRSEGHFEEAVEELRRLAAETSDGGGRLLLVQILLDDLGRDDEALEVALEDLRGSAWHDESASIALMAVDILVENGNLEQARAVLQESLRKVRAKNDREALRNRLAALPPQLFSHG